MKLFTQIISIFALFLIFDVSGSAAEVSFSTPFYSVNLNGDMTTLGNTIIWKDTGAANAFGVDVNTSVPTDRNNAYNMKFVDVLSDGAVTFNSSSSTLSIPTGYTVKWAGLYWQGHIVNTALEAGADNSKIGTGANANAIYNNAKSKANSVYFKLPSGLDYNLTAQVYYDYPTDVQGQTDRRYLYSGFYDITNYVKAAGNGSYTVGNLRTSEGTIGTWGGLGGWAMLVIYEDPSGTLQLKNISLFHGYRVLNSGQSQDINVSGFYTPTAGTINASVAVFVADGDKLGSNNTGEHLKMWNTSNVLTDINNSANPLLNVFNSSITNFGIDNVVRTPSFSDNLGIDIDRFNVSSYMNHGQSSTKIQVSTVGDLFTLDLIAFATDIYQPKICYMENIFKGTTNISGIGAQVNQDDNLTVRVYVKNVGNEVANNVQVSHQFDSSFPYVVNSANYNNSNPGYQTVMPPSYTRTSTSDSSGNDLYEYNSTSLLEKINLGVGATSSSGGTFNPNSGGTPTYAVFEYNATVKVLDNNYSNVYKAAYVNSALGIDYSANPLTLSSCDGLVNSFYGYSAPVATGTIDAVDTYSNATYTDANGPDIQTKVVSTPNVTLQAVWLGSTNAPQAYSNTTYDTPVIMRLSDSTCTTDENLTNSVTGVVATFVKNTTFTAVTSNSFTIVPNARPNAKVKLSYINWSKKFQDANFNCANSNNDATLLGVPACLASATQMTNAFGAAVSAACSATGTRPACSTSSYNNTNVPSYPYDNDYGCYQCLAGLVGQNTCSTDSFALRPKDFFTNLTAGQVLVAKQPASITIQARDYSNVATAGYNETENSSFKGDVNISDSTKICAQPSITFSPNINFSEGSATGNYNFGNVGDFNVTIHEINGTEFSHVDFDDTSDTNRIITPFTQQIKIIPAHFAVDGNLTNGSNGFTYLSNFQDYNTTASRNISAGLDLNITAQAFDNNVTSNYTSTCYAKDGNINVAINPFAMTPAGAVTKMIWYEVNHDTNGSMGIPVNSFIMPFVHNAFDAAGANGTARVKYKLNFDRSQTKTVDPQSLIATNITVTDADTVSGAKIPTTNSAYYVYGRIVPRNIRTFGSGAFTANAWYEVFNTTSIGATELPASKNDPLWFTSILHNDVNDGNSDVTVVITGANPASAAAVNGMEAYSFGAGYALGGYNAHIRTAPWLLYGSTALPYRDPANPANLDCLTHPCFNVNMIPSIGASGSAKSTNRTTKESKKSTVETGGWKSTNDYAPAIL